MRIDYEIQDAITKAVNDHTKLLQKKKESFIKDMFSKKGFANVLDTIGDRFPKMAAVVNDGWSYYYADDGSMSGVFIVAISNEYDFSEAGDKEDKFKYVMSISFKWHEVEPIYLKLANDKSKTGVKK